MDVSKVIQTRNHKL